MFEASMQTYHSHYEAFEVGVINFSPKQFLYPVEKNIFGNIIVLIQDNNNNNKKYIYIYMYIIQLEWTHKTNYIFALL